VLPQASLPQPSANQAFGIKGLSPGGAQPVRELEGLGGEAERLLTEGESVWRKETSVVWKLQGFQPLPPKPEWAVHLPHPTQLPGQPS
jgi:hypothetical protein